MSFAADRLSRPDRVTPAGAESVQDKNLTADIAYIGLIRAVHESGIQQALSSASPLFGRFAACIARQTTLDWIPDIHLVLHPMSLSPKQSQVLAFILQFMDSHELPPTRGEIADGLGLKNRQGIDQHLRALASKGAIELVPGISRGIRLRRQMQSAISAANGPPGRNAQPDDTHLINGTALPLLGRIAAGSPLLAESNIEDYVKVDPALFKPRASFMLRVRGDSMEDADILDRDLLAVHQTAQVRNGQIVVARIDDEATVKYYRRQGHSVRLEPANPAYKPIEVDLKKQELVIEGLAVGVVRTGLQRGR